MLTSKLHRILCNKFLKKSVRFLKKLPLYIYIVNKVTINMILVTIGAMMAVISMHVDLKKASVQNTKANQLWKLKLPEVSMLHRKTNQD